MQVPYLINTQSHNLPYKHFQGLGRHQEMLALVLQLPGVQIVKQNSVHIYIRTIGKCKHLKC